MYPKPYENFCSGFPPLSLVDFLRCAPLIRRMKMETFRQKYMSWGGFGNSFRIPSIWWFVDLLHGSVCKLVLRIRDLVFFVLFLAPGSGSGTQDGEKIGSGMNIPDHIFESLEANFWDKNTSTHLYGSGMEKTDPWSDINIPVPQHCCKLN
jgi:hypothetical protein